MVYFIKTKREMYYKKFQINNNIQKIKTSLTIFNLFVYKMDNGRLVKVLKDFIIYSYIFFIQSD